MLSGHRTYICIYLNRVCRAWLHTLFHSCFMPFARQDAAWREGWAGIGSTNRSITNTSASTSAVAVVVVVVVAVVEVRLVFIHTTFSTRKSSCASSNKNKSMGLLARLCFYCCWPVLALPHPNAIFQLISSGSGPKCLKNNASSSLVVVFSRVDA